MAVSNIAKETPLYGAMVEKFSMGRSTGIQVRNWQNRYLAIFPTAIAYFTDEETCTKKGKPKFEAGIKNFSLCILNASEKDHTEAKGPLLFILRVWDNGVFDILIRPKSPDDKAQFMAAIRKATEGVKGFQMVGDADVLGGEDSVAFGDDEEVSVPRAKVPKRKAAEPEPVEAPDNFESPREEDDDI